MLTRLVLVGTVALALLGCGDNSVATDAAVAIDGGSTIDAVPAPDADPSCVAWRLERVSLSAASLLETTPVHPERSARLVVAALQCPGDLTAQTSYGATLENEFLVLDVRVWRSAPDCSAPEVVYRPVTVKFLYAGSWTVQTSGAPLLVEVVNAPSVACGATSGSCQLDCDCDAGEACLSGIGLGGPFAACARPCEADRDCGNAGACLSVDDGLQYVCIDGVDECNGSTRPCPTGFACEGGACKPTFALNGTTRHACSCDSECDEGLRCAWQFGASEGRCDALCLTNSDGWCEGPHSCSVTVESQSDGVCGWVGD